MFQFRVAYVIGGGDMGVKIFDSTGSTIVISVDDNIIQSPAGVSTTLQPGLYYGQVYQTYWTWNVDYTLSFVDTTASSTWQSIKNSYKQVLLGTVVLDHTDQILFQQLPHQRMIIS